MRPSPIPDQQILDLNPWWWNPEASRRGTEVDFVTAEDVAGVRGGRFPVEVKGDSVSAISNARKSIGAAFGRGIIVTESIFDPDHAIPAVPVPVFLAALRERSERKQVDSDGFLLPAAKEGDALVRAFRPISSCAAELQRSPVQQGRSGRTRRPTPPGVFPHIRIASRRVSAQDLQAASAELHILPPQSRPDAAAPS